MGDISALELWHLFSSMIEGLFSDEANLEVFPPNEYITLLFTVSYEDIWIVIHYTLSYQIIQRLICLCTYTVNQ